jgi:hypothetical protein
MFPKKFGAGAEISLCRHRLLSSTIAFGHFARAPSTTRFSQTDPWHRLCAPTLKPADGVFSGLGSKAFKPYFQLKEGECQCNSGGCQCRGGPVQDFIEWASHGVRHFFLLSCIVFDRCFVCLFPRHLTTLQETLQPTQRFIALLAALCVWSMT